MLCKKRHVTTVALLATSLLSASWEDKFSLSQMTMPKIWKEVNIHNTTDMTIKINLALKNRPRTTVFDATPKSNIQIVLNDATFATMLDPRNNNSTLLFKPASKQNILKPGKNHTIRLTKKNNLEIAAKNYFAIIVNATRSTHYIKLEDTTIKLPSGRETPLTWSSKAQGFISSKRGSSDGKIIQLKPAVMYIINQTIL
jgi:hypothetical protein